MAIPQRVFCPAGWRPSILVASGADVRSVGRASAHVWCMRDLAQGIVLPFLSIPEFGEPERFKYITRSMWNATFTTLHAAALCGHLDVANLLLEHGPDKDSKPKLGMTALYLASLVGHQNMVIRLLQLGVSVDEHTQPYLHPHMIAVCMGHREMTRLLVRNRGLPPYTRPTSSILADLSASHTTFPISETEDCPSVPLKRKAKRCSSHCSGQPSEKITDGG